MKININGRGSDHVHLQGDDAKWTSMIRNGSEIEYFQTLSSTTIRSQKGIGAWDCQTRQGTVNSARPLN